MNFTIKEKIILSLLYRIGVDIQVEIAEKWLKDLPNHQREIFWNLANNIGYGVGDHFNHVPVSTTPDKFLTLKITSMTTDESSWGSLTISTTIKTDNVSDLPVMDYQEMMVLAR